MEKILITGANGYIGNCLFHFLKGKFKVIGIDKEKTFNNKIYKCNILNTKKIDQIIKKEKPEIVVHLAAQSLVDPKINKKNYLRDNIIATNCLLKLIKKNKIKKLIFSSTASVYRYSNFPLKENSKTEPLSNYAKSKLACEKNIIKNKNINSVILRFFNVCGALDKPKIGLLKAQVTHLIPTVVYKTLFNKKIYIYGNDYKTPDGTCIRDYVHIKDICSVIKKSIIFLKKKNNSEIFNVGNRVGISNKSVVDCVKKITKKKIKLEYAKRRKGDIAKTICNSGKAKRKLLWQSKNSNLNDIVRDEINWIKEFNKMGLKRTFKSYK